MLLQLSHDVGNCRLLLADRDIYALNAGRLLVDDRVDGQCRLACLTVTDDQLALSASDRHHRVNRLVTGLNRLADRLSVDDARRHALDGSRTLGIDRALAIDRLPERVHYAAEQLGAYGHFEDAASGLDRVTFGQMLVVTQHDRADRVLLEVQRQAIGVARELEHLAVTRIGQTMNAGD